MSDGKEIMLRLRQAVRQARRSDDVNANGGRWHAGVTTRFLVNGGSSAGPLRMNQFVVRR